ncbi:EamA family transporter [Phycicoccus sp. CSK15P-2]|uniref:EamA family transporter n=1 Tax=Phycicoccus sp. CSK15P-2 TaxID=2807627 RepID=UPI0027DB81D8|nr:EamA family transporter [Phycicoccus sp. CSK15P-2]
MEDTSPRLRTALVTAVAPVAWGSTYAVTQLWLPPDRPMFAAAARILPAGVLMLLWLRRLPRGAWWGRAAVLGTLNHAVFFGLLYVAAYRLPSGLASTLTALSPLVVMAVAWLALRERQPPVTVLAALAGIAGVVLLVWQNDRSGPVDPAGVAAAVGAIVSASTGFVLVKRWTRPGEVLVTTSWQLVAGGLALVPVALLVEGPPPALDVPGALALTYLGLVGSVLAYTVWFRGLTRMDAGAVAVVGLVNPVVGTVLGVVLLGEAFGPVHLAAMVLVLGSVLVAQEPVRRSAVRFAGRSAGRARRWSEEAVSCPPRGARLSSAPHGGRAGTAGDWGRARSGTSAPRRTR